jgi:phage terminase large subunit-like protein
MKEKSVLITPNAVLRFCAENAEVERNTYGEIRVVKPDERTRLAKKVDGITAIVSALVEARRHEFPAAKRQWQGTVEVI